MMEDESLEAAVLRSDTELDESKKKLKVMHQALYAERDQLDEYKETQDLRKRLKAAELRLKGALQSNGTVTRLMANIHEQKALIKDLGRIRSAHLVRYQLDHPDQYAFPIGHKLQKPILLSASLGKEEPENTTIFDEKPIEISGDMTKDDLAEAITDKIMNPQRKLKIKGGDGKEKKIKPVVVA